MTNILGKTVLILIFMLALGVVSAGERHHKKKHPEPAPEQSVVNDYSVVNNYADADTVLGISMGQAQFDWTTSWQGSATCATYNGENSCALAVAKRTGRVLWNGVLGYVPSSGKYGAAVTGNWRF